MLSPARTVEPPEMLHVSVVPEALQLPPTWPCLGAVLSVTIPLLVRCASPVPDGNAIVIVLPAAPTIPPVEDVVNVVLYATPVAAAAPLLSVTLAPLALWAAATV